VTGVLIGGVVPEWRAERELRLNGNFEEPVHLTTPKSETERLGEINKSLPELPIVEESVEQAIQVEPSFIAASDAQVMEPVTQEPQITSNEIAQCFNHPSFQFVPSESQQNYSATIATPKSPREPDVTFEV
jgi:hypothetical protein